MHISSGQPPDALASPFVLFPGKSCFPMSPTRAEEGDEGSQYDQLNVIFNVIGSPTEQEIEKVQDETAKQYLLKLARKGGIPSQDLATLFPGASEAAIDLLKVMLRFDTEQRITIQEAMSHPFFDEGGAREGNLYAPIECSSVVEGALSFDFEHLANPSSSDLMKLMVEEIARFRANQSQQECEAQVGSNHSAPNCETPVDESAPEESPPKKQRL